MLNYKLLFTHFSLLRYTINDFNRITLSRTYPNTMLHPEQRIPRNSNFSWSWSVVQPFVPGSLEPHAQHLPSKFIHACLARSISNPDTPFARSDLRRFLRELYT